MKNKREKKYLIDNEKLMSEWDWVKNNELNFNPNNLTLGNNKDRVFWICEKGHSWKTTIYCRSTFKTNCPYCYGRYATKETCLATLNPLLTKEWDFDKNIELTPYEVKPNSHKEVWWKCNKGHSWKAFISDRNSRGNGCPICNAESHSSFPEQSLYFFIKQVCPDALNRYKYNKKFEADIFIPSKNIAIEYDGFYYHKNNLNDIKKDNYFKQEGIVLIRVKEGVETSTTDNIIGVKRVPSISDLENSFNELFILLNKNHNISMPKEINIKEKELDILNLFIGKQKEESIASNPKLYKEWDFEKNLNIDPSLISIYSNRNFWWICEKRHSWKASCNNRIKGKDCPVCSNRVILQGFNDLETVNPNLIKYWNFEKNLISPKEVSYGSDKKVWWTCENGHDYYMAIQRVSSGRGCPICAGKKVVTGVNDLYTLFPQLILEWDYNYNEKDPKNITAYTDYKAKWICNKCNHSWIATVQSRTKGRGCPKCARLIAKKSLQLSKVKEQGSLADDNPDLLNEWNWAKNGLLNLNPYELPPGSTEKAWWTCRICNHEWQTQINLRAKLGCGCQHCNNRRNKKPKS